MHPPHSAVFCNKGKAPSARENTSHERPTFEQATLGAHKPKGQSTHGTHDHVPKHKKVSAHRSTRTAHRDTARPVFQPNKGTRSDTRAPRIHTPLCHTPSCALHPRRAQRSTSWIVPTTTQSSCTLLNGTQHPVNNDPRATWYVKPQGTPHR
jgi:hypothetical protein